MAGARAPRANRGAALIGSALVLPGEASAVEAFADSGVAEGHYRALVPLSAPAPGQQYAFEVDLDRCTGCKACVTACHSMNDLDDGEVWRTTGLLVGGSAAEPALQTVTTSCHHCVDPACLAGCPARAYHKDPATGIVEHIAEHCLGCQYCLFMCPYDAPKYSPSRGIVRKCDMCKDKLAAGATPACVASCPGEAIRITLVDTREVIAEAETGALVPGAHAPADTLPTTTYAARRALPRNLLPADYYQVNRQHAHPALVVMLVLTQLAVGALAVRLALGGDGGGAALARASALAGFGVGGLALLASLFHLGQPRRAWRALAGLTTSWLSREVLAFGVFMAACAGYAAAQVTGRRGALLEIAAVAAGAAGVLCSVWVYAATRRPQWRASVTMLRFGATAAMLGGTLDWLLAAAVAHTAAPGAAALALAGAAVTILVDGWLLSALRGRQHSPLKRTAILMVGELGGLTTMRFLCAGFGGVLMPALHLGGTHEVALPAAALALTLIGALLERYIFFAAAAPPRMPGGPA